MDTLVFKVVASPLLIQAASLAGRRRGPAVGGWFVGLPLTSGPVAFFLAVDRGTGFAATAALGSLAGTAAQAGFCLAYGFAARRHSWPAAFSGFFLVIALTIERIGIAASLALASFVAGTIQVSTLRIISGSRSSSRCRTGCG